MTLVLSSTYTKLKKERHTFWVWFWCVTQSSQPALRGGVHIRLLIQLELVVGGLGWAFFFRAVISQLSAFRHVCFILLTLPCNLSKSMVSPEDR